MSDRPAHPDNQFIDAAEQLGGDSQQSSAGGNVARNVNSRAELTRATGEDLGVERVTAQDNPAEAEEKGEKSLGKIRSARPR